jgi:methionyl-tRNA formyltransferase
LFAKGADAILNSQFSIFNQIPISQNHNKATYTKKLTRQDGFVSWDSLTSNIEDLRTKQRAFFPWPGVWTIDPQGKRIKVQ